MLASSSSDTSTKAYLGSRAARQPTTMPIQGHLASGGPCCCAPSRDSEWLGLPSLFSSRLLQHALTHGRAGNYHIEPCKKMLADSTRPAGYLDGRCAAVARYSLKAQAARAREQAGAVQGSWQAAAEWSTRWSTRLDGPTTHCTARGSTYRLMCHMCMKGNISKAPGLLRLLNFLLLWWRPLPLPLLLRSASPPAPVLAVPAAAAPAAVVAAPLAAAPPIAETVCAAAAAAGATSSAAAVRWRWQRQVPVITGQRLQRRRPQPALPSHTSAQPQPQPCKTDTPPVLVAPQDQRPPAAQRQAHRGLAL